MLLQLLRVMINANTKQRYRTGFVTFTTGYFITFSVYSEIKILLFRSSISQNLIYILNEKNFLCILVAVHPKKKHFELTLYRLTTSFNWLKLNKRICVQYTTMVCELCLVAERTKREAQWIKHKWEKIKIHNRHPGRLY